MFLNIHMLFIVLKTYDQQFTLTTKKSLHIIFKDLGSQTQWPPFLADIVETRDTLV